MKNLKKIIGIVCNEEKHIMFIADNNNEFWTKWINDTNKSYYNLIGSIEYDVINEKSVIEVMKRALEKWHANDFADEKELALFIKGANLMLDFLTVYKEED